MSTEKEKYIGESPILGVPEKALRLKLRNESVTMEKLSPEVKSVIDSGGKGVVNVTRADLIDLRENEELVPSRFYRITDYMAHNTYNATKYAGHQFDVMVMALDASSLSQTAYARPHEGDTYFSNCDLNAWQLHYSLGDGEITWMRDEHNNECNYDFKNRLWKRYQVINDLRSAFSGNYLVSATGQAPEGMEYNSNNYAYCYTFSSSAEVANPTDLSIDNSSNISYNVIDGIDNVFFGISCGGNRLVCSEGNTFIGDTCLWNYIDNSNNNICGYDFCNNLMCWSDNNSFGDICTNNVIFSLKKSMFNNCTNNSFNNNSYIKVNLSNSDCSVIDNSFSPGCEHLTFEHGCTASIFCSYSRYTKFTNSVAGAFIEPYFGGSQGHIITTPMAADYIGMKANGVTPGGGRIMDLFEE